MTDYFRGDQENGITAPDLSKSVEYADHIVKARGKRTQFTSVSKDPVKIRDFGEQIYKLKQQELKADDHQLVDHEGLMDALRKQARESSKGAKIKAVQALRYAKARMEGLVDWEFNIDGVDRKSLLTWAAGRVSQYFAKQ